MEHDATALLCQPTQVTTTSTPSSSQQQHRHEGRKSQHANKDRGDDSKSLTLCLSSIAAYYGMLLTIVHFPPPPCKRCWRQRRCSQYMKLTKRDTKLPPHTTTNHAWCPLQKMLPEKRSIRRYPILSKLQGNCAESTISIGDGIAIPVVVYPEQHPIESVKENKRDALRSSSQSRSASHGDANNHRVDCPPWRAPASTSSFLF